MGTNGVGNRNHRIRPIRFHVSYQILHLDQYHSEISIIYLLTCKLIGVTRFHHLCDYKGLV